MSSPKRPHIDPEVLQDLAEARISALQTLADATTNAQLTAALRIRAATMLLQNFNSQKVPRWIVAAATKTTSAKKHTAANSKTSKTSWRCWSATAGRRAQPFLFARSSSSRHDRVRARTRSR